jgi:hypothetical protein
MSPASGGRSGRRPTIRGHQSSRPLLEVLEARTLLSTDVVSNTNDSGAGSLRDTVAHASPGDTLTFARGFSGAIILTSGPIGLAQAVDIEGPGAQSLTIKGNGGIEIFDVEQGATANIAGLTLSEGSGLLGGSIFSHGTLTIANSTLSDNSASFGGAIWSDGTLTITNSTVSGNSAVSGGGIFNVGTLTIANSTFWNNSASDGGGGIFNHGPLSVANSTFSANTSGEGGGGIENQTTAIIADTIIAGAKGSDVAGNFISLGFNLIGDSSGGSGFVASDLLGVNPLLGPLQDNGGPTGAAGASVSLTNTLGSSSQLVIHTEPPATAIAGKVFGTRPVVYVEDQYGNVQTGDNSTQVTVSLASGRGPLRGMLTVTVSGGIAIFTNLTATAAENISLYFNSGAALASATSNSIAITPAQAQEVVIHTQPSATATAGKAFGIQPVIYEEDQYGNLETGDNNTQVTATLRRGTGQLDATTTVRVTGGIATFTNLADNKAETITLVFADGGLVKDVSNTIVVGAASARTLSIATHAKAGSALVKTGAAHPGSVASKQASRHKSRHAMGDVSRPHATKAHTQVRARSQLHGEVKLAAIRTEAMELFGVKEKRD